MGMVQIIYCCVYTYAYRHYASIVVAELENGVFDAAEPVFDVVGFRRIVCHSVYTIPSCRFGHSGSIRVSMPTVV